MSATRDEVRDAVARAIAHGLGDNFDHAFVTKAEWTQARGENGGRARDINEPMQGDYLDAADAALAAAEQAGWRLVPAVADEAMWDAGRYQIVAGEGALDIWAAMLAAAPKVGE